MTNIHTFPLIDGSLSKPVPTKEQTVAEMAAILVSADAYQTEAGAMRVLMASKAYGTFELLYFIDDARQVAAREVVAREMADQP